MERQTKKTVANMKLESVKILPATCGGKVMLVSSLYSPCYPSYRGDEHCYETTVFHKGKNKKKWLLCTSPPSIDGDIYAEIGKNLEALHELLNPATFKKSTSID